MKRIFTVYIILITCMILFADNDAKRYEEVEIGVDSQTFIIPQSGNVFRSNTPQYQIVGGAVNIATSYYDYFPGSYSSTNIVKQPSPAGFYDGGGLYIVNMITPEAGGVRRLYYTYILDGDIIGTGLIDAGREGPEGFPGICMDYETGNPFVTWHGRLPGNPDWQVFFTFDQYSAIGFPGLWNEPYCVINNTDIGEGYIWPSIKIGPSPTEGKKRIYIFGTNSAPIEPTTQGNNKYLAFVDFEDVSDIASFNPEDWTMYEVPYMREWAEIYLRSYDDIVVTDDGKVAIVGSLFDWGSYQDTNWPGGYSEKDALFVLVNDNYGEGETAADWKLYTQYSNLPVENPDDYFADEGTPLDYLWMVPFAPRFSAEVDANGDVIMPMTYRMSSTQANRLYFNQGFIKLVRFNFEEEEFTVTDVYPKSENPEAFPYVPWDPEGDGTWEYQHVEEDSFLVVRNFWPVWWYDNADFQSENYVRIAQTGRYVAVVFQECLKARWHHEYGFENYAGWANTPETYIVLSDDYGRTWYDPIVMNAKSDDVNYETMLNGMIPSYYYIGDTIDDLGNGWIRLHLTFYDQNSYGSSIQDNSLPTGGTIIYHRMDVNLGSSVDDTVDNRVVANMLKANYPNPFNPTTTISYSLTKNDRVNLSIYNVKGQLVKTLIDDYQQIGEQTAVWNGIDSNDREVGSGVYFYKLTTSTNSEMRKMLLIK